MRKIEKLETETVAKQNDLETLRKEKVRIKYKSNIIVDDK